MPKISGGMFGGMSDGMKSICVMRLIVYNCLIVYKQPILHCQLLICEQV